MEVITFLEKTRNMLKNKGKMAVLLLSGMLGTGIELPQILRGNSRVVKEAARQTARETPTFNGWPRFGGGYRRMCNRRF